MIGDRGAMTQEGRTMTEALLLDHFAALMKLCDALDARIAEREEAGTRLIASVVAGAS
jgi:hypothetical protein